MMSPIKSLSFWFFTFSRLSFLSSAVYGLSASSFFLQIDPNSILWISIHRPYCTYLDSVLECDCNICSRISCFHITSIHMLTISSFRKICELIINASALVLSAQLPSKICFILSLYLTACPGINHTD